MKVERVSAPLFYPKKNVYRESVTNYLSSDYSKRNSRVLNTEGQLCQSLVQRFNDDRDCRIASAR